MPSAEVDSSDQRLRSRSGRLVAHRAGLRDPSRGLATALFGALHRQEAGEGFSTEQLIGARGRCTLALGPNQSGRVLITHGGMTRSFSATSDTTIPTGAEVVVTDTVGNALTVAPATAPSAPG